MSLEKEAQILEVVSSTPCGIRDISLKLRWKTSRVVSLSKRMSKERLIEFQTVRQSSRGRPKKNIVCTSLGLEFLETYRKLKLVPLRATKEDLERAVRDALYTQRLVDHGHSPFKLFMELNTIALNINKSSQTANQPDLSEARSTNTPVKGILTRQANKLDNEYLTKKAKQAGVLTVLQTIQAR